MKNDNKIIRPPIVAVLGHIDHGKTTLIEFLKKQNLTQKESGGITQHIGAHEIDYQGKKFTLLDTPGHEAFSKLRQRGAQAADVAILVVAADEGVKPQTKESFLQIKAAGIPLVVAINKVDKPEANIDKTKRNLAENEIMLEGWGGNIPGASISAKTGQGINELLDLFFLTYELSPKYADPTNPAQGIIIETYKDARLGGIISLIIQDGSLKVGDYLLTESINGKIKIIKDQNNKNISRASFTSPVMVCGPKELPLVGEIFLAAENEDKIQELKDKLTKKDKLSKKITEVVPHPQTKYKLIIKADAVGSLEAIQELFKNEQDFLIFRSGLGDVSDEDIKMAKAVGAVIVNFGVKTPKELRLLILDYKIPTVESNIIYELKDKVIDLFKKEAQKVKKIPGELEVLAIFSKSASKITVGGKVIKGEFKINDGVDILRNNESVGRGKIDSLKIFKNEVDKIQESQEAGLEIKTAAEIQKGDLVREVI